MWQKEFTKILLINLPERKDRLKLSTDELFKHDITDFEVIPAVKHNRGAYGLYLTLKVLFERAEREDWDNILIFEDDVKIIDPHMNVHLDKAVEELKILAWDLLYLGGNVNAPLDSLMGKHRILHCTQILSTHAVAYSKVAWKLCLQEMRRIESAGIGVNVEPFDMMLLRVIQQPREKTFICSPMIAVQSPGYSDIEERHTDYKNLIEDRFNERYKQMIW